EPRPVWHRLGCEPCRLPGRLLRRGVAAPRRPAVDQPVVPQHRHRLVIDSPAMGLDLNIGSLCAHTVDDNSDGWPDLLVCGEAGGLHLFKTTRATASPMCPRSSAPR